MSSKNIITITYNSAWSLDSPLSEQELLIASGFGMFSHRPKSGMASSKKFKEPCSKENIFSSRSSDVGQESDCNNS